MLSAETQTSNPPPIKNERERHNFFSPFSGEKNSLFLLTRKLLCGSDVFVRGEEEDDVSFLIFNGDDVQKAPKHAAVLLIKLDLGLQFGLFCQSLFDLLLVVLVGFGAVEELARATLLHDLSPGEAGELTEAVAAVDDRVGVGHLSVAQHEIAICGCTEERGRK